MKYNYREIVIGQIQHITQRIGFDGAELIDIDFTGFTIEELLRTKYDIDISIPRGSKDYQEIVLTNWIYVHYYQNRGKLPLTARSQERHFPFDEIFQGGTDGYWRNRFWQYDQVGQERDRPVLTRGYDTLVLESHQFAEDEIVFESSVSEENVRKFEEIKFLSISLPKFEIGEGYKYVNGRHPLDNAGLGSIVRFYIRFNPATLTLAIPLLISRISSIFNDRLIPFRMKFSFTNDEFQRSDHCVVYIERRHFYVAAILVRAFYDDICEFLDGQLPYFVRQLLPGIGFGSTPNRGSSSFGASRSTVISKAILFLLNGRQGKPVEEHLSEVWGDIGNFYLNPQPRFLYNFSVFDPCKGTNLFPGVGSDKPLAAAWYIARLLCREAIWVSQDECIWMSYQLTEKNQYGYRFMDVDTGLAGLQGVITFLEGFGFLRIQDPVVERILEGAREYQRNNARRVSSPQVGVSNHPATGLNKIVIPPDGFKNPKLRQEVYSAIQEPLPQAINLMLFMQVIVDHIEKERPAGNMLDGSDHFCADMYFGYAAYGYACLRLHNPISIVRLKL